MKLQDLLPSLTQLRLPSLQHNPPSELTSFVVDATRASDDWSLRVDRDGVRVWRRSVPGSPHDEVRGNGLIQASPRQVVALMRKSDEETIRSYNPTYDSGYDLQTVDASTKVTYGVARSVFPFRPRDTVTKIIYRQLAPSQLDSIGGSVLLLGAAEHPAMPPRRGFVRARLIRGLTLMQPVPHQPGVTNFTFTQQVDAGGVIPAWLMNVLIAQDSVNFITRVGLAAAREEAT